VTVPHADLAVRLRPRSHGDQIVGVVDGVLEVRVSAPPVDERANRALCRLIAKAAGMPASRVTIQRGARSREKLVRVEGLDRAALERRLGLGPAPRG
jgi:uncharacterized protein